MYSTKSITWSKEEKEKENGAKRRRRKLRERKLQISWQWTNDVNFLKMKKKKIVWNTGSFNCQYQSKLERFFFFFLPKNKKGHFLKLFFFLQKFVKPEEFLWKQTEDGGPKGYRLWKRGVGGGGVEGQGPPRPQRGFVAAVLGGEISFLFLFFIFYFFICLKIYIK